MATPGTADSASTAPGELALVQPSRVRPAGAGWTWIAQGWGFFARAALMWIASIVILFIIFQRTLLERLMFGEAS